LTQALNDSAVCLALPAAERLLVPTPTPRITPPREGLQAVRSGLGVATLPEASHRRLLLLYL
jgi:hypothetical protein